MFNQAGFRHFLDSRKLTEGQIQQHFQVVDEFRQFLNDQPATAETTQKYIALLVEAGRDNYDSLVAVARYGLFTKNNPVYLAILELLDGGEAMGNLYRRLGEMLGEIKRDEIFEGVVLPTLGIPLDQRARITRQVMEQLALQVDEEICRKIFSSSLRDLDDAWYQGDKQKYDECENIDVYIERKREEFITQLEEIKNEDRLFFNQKITDEVIAFVRENPEVSVGLRKGNTLFVTKIPYLAMEYLAETDPQKKRYYYCHCPWVRESLQQGEQVVSSDFCQCSAGFHKKPWEVIFEQPLQADVLESVLKGDLRCRFAIHLPGGAVPTG